MAGNGGYVIKGNSNVVLRLLTQNCGPTSTPKGGNCSSVSTLILG